jgi:Uma2 family endonuclease
MATIQVRIGPADHGRRMTLDEFREAEEEQGYCYELARGVLEVTEVPNAPHWQVLDNLHEAISRYRRHHRGVILRIGHGSECRLLIPETASGRNPGLAIVFHDTPEDARGRRPPELAVEIVSPGREAHERDYVTKRGDYLAFGLRECWIVDPLRRQVTVLVREDRAEAAGWAEHVFRGDEMTVSPLLEGFAARVSELWADAEFDPEG